MQLKKGMRFYHARVLDSRLFDGSPQLYQVTRIAQGVVYYRPVYDYGDREGLGTVAYTPLGCFDKIISKEKSV